MKIVGDDLVVADPLLKRERARSVSIRGQMHSGMHCQFE